MGCDLVRAASRQGQRAARSGQLRLGKARIGRRHGHATGPGLAGGRMRLHGAKGARHAAGGLPVALRQAVNRGAKGRRRIEAGLSLSLGLVAVCRWRAIGSPRPAPRLLAVARLMRALGTLRLVEIGMLVAIAAGLIGKFIVGSIGVHLQS